MSDKVFARLAEAIGRPELAEDESWATIRRREAEREAVDAAVTEWTLQHDRNESCWG